MFVPTYIQSIYNQYIESSVTPFTLGSRTQAYLLIHFFISVYVESELGVKFVIDVSLEGYSYVDAGLIFQGIREKSYDQLHTLGGYLYLILMVFSY